MGTQKTSKNKIGARCLTEHEAKLILPTYSQIYDQIEKFRQEKKFTGKDDQKTNNIGIMGVRGAGKTSILRTISTELKQNKCRIENESDRRQNHDIILPIVVPENMSASGTLMAAILGMLREEVLNRETKKEKKGNPYCIRESRLQECYRAVLKQYTYIQKEYRDILLTQYTTENDYVNSSAKVFNSDTEFINKFNDLIELLVNEGEESSNLLILFIDDIDLSTNRCMDVVKTLLSYLANRNIVTFISGHLETFEEALTLEFIRQEKMPDGTLLDMSILARGGGEKTLLESKKQLAYEYLKKILPPVYRHHIKDWSLEERGNYCIQIFDNGQRPDVTLSELLVRSLEGWIEPAFFGRVDSGNKIEMIPYTYHLFDNTSRGLNNVYNVLSEIAEVRGSKENYQEEKKQLLDTIVSSKQIYDQYRSDIQQRMFTVGADSTDSKVFFDNAYAVIYERTKKSIKSENGEEKIAERKFRIEDPVERFSLFLLVDFAARLLYEDKYNAIVEQDKNYEKIKWEAMVDLLFQPAIAEKVIYNNGDYIINQKEMTSYVKTLRTVIMDFLLKGDLSLNLAYYRNLPLDQILYLYEMENKNRNEESLFSAELEQNVLIAFWEAVSFIAEVNGQKILQKVAEYYDTFQNKLDYFQKRISRFEMRNIVIRLFDSEWIIMLEKAYIKRILQNMIAELLEDKRWNDDEVALWEIKPEKIWRFQEMSLEVRKKLKRRIDVLQVIRAENLWKEKMVWDIINFLRREVESYLLHICGNLKKETEQDSDDNWIVDTKPANESWEKFRKAYDGEGKTIAWKTKEAIKKILNDTSGNGENLFENGMSFQQYECVISELSNLAQNNKVWYGQHDAWCIRRDLWEASAKPVDGWQDSHSYFIFLLQCLYQYKKKVEFSDDTMQYASILQEITVGISEANKMAYEQAQSTFLDRLNEKLIENRCEAINVDDFNNLFS